MDHLKFNCYDLAEQNNEMSGVCDTMRRLSDELDEITGSIDPRLLEYADILKNLTVLKKSAADSVSRLSSSCKTLDQIIDIYHAAETKALHEAEALPKAPGAGDMGPALNAIKNSKIQAARVSKISGGNLIVDDWLAELMYKQNK